MISDEKERGGEWEEGPHCWGEYCLTQAVAISPIVAIYIYNQPAAGTSAAGYFPAGEGPRP